MAAFVIALAFWGSAGMVRAQYLPRHAPLPEAAPRPAAAPEGPEADANTLSAEAGEEPETPPTAPIPAKRPEPPRQMAGLPTPPPPADEHEPGPGSGETAPVAGPPVPPEIAPVPPVPGAGPWTATAQALHLDAAAVAGLPVAAVLAIRQLGDLGPRSARAKSD